MTKLLEHRRMLHNLLIFDAWHDLLSSPSGMSLCNALTSSDIKSEQMLGEQIASCIASLPKDTDEWMRLFISSVQDLNMIGVCICDMSLASAPIIHVNKGFEAITGYDLEEVVGSSCRFLQGPNSDPASLEMIHEAISTGSTCQVRLLNYRKDGTAFNNMIVFRPIFDCEGHFVFGVSINVEVVDSFGRLKPLLTQVDRLNKLVPEKLSMLAPPSVLARVSLVHDGLLATRADVKDQMSVSKVREQTSSAQVQVTNAPLTATEKATALAKERSLEYERKRKERVEADAREKAERYAAVQRQPSSTRLVSTRAQLKSARSSTVASASNLQSAILKERPTTARARMVSRATPKANAASSSPSPGLPPIRRPHSGMLSSESPTSRASLSNRSQLTPQAPKHRPPAGDRMSSPRVQVASLSPSSPSSPRLRSSLAPSSPSSPRLRSTSPRRQAALTATTPSSSNLAAAPSRASPRREPANSPSLAQK